MLVWKMFPEFCLYKIPMRVRISLYALWKPHSSWSILLIWKVICAKSAVVAWKLVKQCNFWPSSTPESEFESKKLLNCCRKKPQNYSVYYICIQFCGWKKHLKMLIKNFHWTETLWMPAVRKILSKLFTAYMRFSLSFLSIFLLLFLWLLSSGLLGHPHYVGGFEHIGWMTIRAWLICAKIDGDQWDAAEEITPFFFCSEGEMRWPHVKPNTSSVIDHNCTTRTHL